MEIALFGHVFSKPVPETFFRRPWCRSNTEGSVWAPFSISTFLRRHPSDYLLRPKGHQTNQGAFPLERFWSGPWCDPTPRDQILLYLGLIFDGFWDICSMRFWIVSHVCKAQRHKPYPLMLFEHCDRTIRYVRFLQPTCKDVFAKATPTESHRHCQCGIKRS